MKNNLKEELVKRGFRETESGSRVAYRKDSMWLKKFKDFDYDTFFFGIDLSGILVQMNKTEDFGEFREAVFGALPSRLEALNKLVKTEWTKHVHGETPLTWTLFNNAKVVPFPDTPFITAEIEIGDNATVKVTFGENGKIKKYVDFRWTEQRFKFSAMMEIKGNETPEKIESRLKKFILKEFKACAGRLDEIL